MSKEIKYSNEVRELIGNGVNALANAVKVTLGPKGRNVGMQRPFGPPQITKDGVSVAKEISLSDPFENMGAQLVKEVASKTNEDAGDGTTTATVLAQAIYIEGAKLVAAGHNPMDLKRGIDIATADVLDYLKTHSQTVSSMEDIANIGTISANNDAGIGRMIADAMDKVGKEGVITIEESKTAETYSEIVEGMQFDHGYLSPYFVTNGEKMISEYENPLILLTDKTISNMQEMMGVLEKVTSANRPLIIVAEGLEGDALTALVVNKMRGTLKVSAVKAPGFGDIRKEMLKDMAIVTGGTFISAELGLELSGVELEHLGTAAKVTMTKDSTTIVDGAGDSKLVEERLSLLKRQVEETTSDYDREKLQERMAKLSGGVAILYVGAPSEPEMHEKKDRVEDALNATRAAVEEGIIVGGGVALAKASESFKDMTEYEGEVQFGINILARAIQAPLRQIAQNAGQEASVVYNKTVESNDFNFGYNAREDRYENLLELGIIDPTKVTMSALSNAASVAGLMLTTETLIADIPGEEMGMPMPPMGGGMPGMPGMM